jgi:hypothetical protein
MTTKRTLRRLLAEEKDKNRRLVDARQDALDDADTGQFNSRLLAEQLSDARDEIEDLQRRLKTRPAVAVPEAWTRERSELRRQLRLSEQARASLDRQVRQLGDANERLYREQYDRAQGLAP